MTTITHILVLIIGCLLGGFIVFRFNVPDTQIKGKYKAKKGGIIDLNNIFKRKNK